MDGNETKHDHLAAVTARVVFLIVPPLFFLAVKATVDQQESSNSQ